MVAELHALIHAVDMGIIVGDALNKFLNCCVDMRAFVDSRTLLNLVRESSNTAEHRLLIDVIALRKV